MKTRFQEMGKQTVGFGPMKQEVFRYEIFVMTDDNIEFGLGIQTVKPPTEGEILEIFKRQGKDFWIEATVISIVTEDTTPKQEVTDGTDGTKKDSPSV